MGACRCTTCVLRPTPSGQNRVWNSWDLDDCYASKCILGTKSESSTKAESVPNRQAISPAPN